jgi:hypothetical protein
MSDAVFKAARSKPLVLKGGLSLAAKKEPAGNKKRKATDADAAADGAPGAAGQGGGEAVGAASAGGIGGPAGGPATKTYEELFASEMARAREAKGRTSAWGTNFRAAPEVLHGYSERLDTSKPLTSEQRLDLRAATKADKFCR